MSPPALSGLTALTEQERAACRAARESVALFRRPGRRVVQVSGGDRISWLDGMVSGDVRALAAAGPGASCPALLLTPQGRVVADLQVLLLEDALWLDLSGDAVAAVLERLSRYVIADDVVLEDRGDALARMALEGPRALDLLRAACGDRALAPPAGSFVRGELEGASVVALAESLAGGSGLQLFLPREREEAVAAALAKAGEALGLVEGDAAALECLRVEAGVPRLGRELDESVLPAEARMERAVSTTKGCYTGQEVVARMRTRGRLSHLLVGLRFQGVEGTGGEAPGAAVRLERDGKVVGEVTSAVLSPELGAIGLGYVRTELAEPDTRLRASAEGGAAADAVVAELPFPRA